MTPKRTSRTRPLRVRLTRLFGWLLLGCGAGVLLYLAYALLFTNITAERAQDDLRARWQQQVPTVSDAASQSAPSPSQDRPGAPARGVAMVEFERPGRPTPLVHDGPLVVLDGVTLDDLARGPGHYPGTALPGRPGNFAIAGHRTTHGAPFFHLDALRSGDLVLVTDRRGRHYTYEVAAERLVLPTDTWVIGRDPLGTGRPTLTLTTCNPRFSAAERLVVHAQLVS